MSEDELATRSDTFPKVSVVIAAKGLNQNTRICLERCYALDYPAFEIIILPDDPLGEEFPKVKVLPTGPKLPAAKRDMALLFAQGELIAFLDDDAFPEKDWLKNAAPYFVDEEVAGVGGPAVTPPESTGMERASGLIYSSLLGGGTLAHRYVPKKAREVDDYPTCNLIVRKSILDQLGGINTKFWPGEDTKLCLDITKGLGKKILYAPEVLVYHSRRPLFGPHLRQVKSYALHRGYFVKRYPPTSLRLSYILPSALVLGIILGPLLSLIHPLFLILYLSGLAAYYLMVLVSSLVQGDLKLAWAVASGLILTHFTYGIWFLKGLSSSRMKEE
ncbi:MAG: glycosyltransferase [Chloroflexi bacterium]|nr:glycosyltransferase [Chloroflexota bacterium]